MDLGRLVGMGQVGGAHDPAVLRLAGGLLLLLAQDGVPEGVGVVVAIGRQLHLIDGKAGVAGLAAPQGNQRLHALGILQRVQAHVGLALVPDHALEGVLPHGRPLAVIHDGGAVHLEDPAPGERVGGHAGIASHDFPGEPAFHAAAAPGVVDDAHGHVQHLVQVLGEEPRGGAELRRVVRAALLPGGVHDVLGRIRAHLGNGGETDAAPVAAGFGDLLQGAVHGAVVEAPERHLHVALAAAQPHFADQHVAEHDLLATGADRDRLLLVASGGGGHLHRPGAVPVRLGGIAAAVPGRAYGNAGAGVGPAPEPGLRLLLQDHVLTDV